MAVVGLVLDTLPVLDVMAFALLTLHNLVDDARRTVLAIVVKATSEHSLLTFAVALVKVSASVVTTPVLVEVGA
jgi:hypothetical protein